jgi:large subunit ribosomal protein L30
MAPEETESKANENRAQAKPKAKKDKPAAEMIRVKLVRSTIGSSPHQRKVVAGLGLRRMNQVVERQDTREIRGMVAKVSHLVRVVS